MRAMVLTKPGQPLALMDIERPKPDKGQLLLKVHACGICRTDLHIYDSELDSPKLPLVMGHQIVGTIISQGKGAEAYPTGSRVGVPWLGWSCGKCEYCLSRRENLCDNAKYTGYQIDGGFAQYCIADQRFCFPIPDGYPDIQAAPLLCAGLIGYRSLRMTENAQTIAFYGFGAAAHILIQVTNYQGKQVYAFSRSEDTESQNFARKLGAVWAGSSDQQPPEQLDAAIIFAPVGDLVPAALKAVKRGGVVVCGGIHMSDIPAFPYRILWEERVIRSVANLTRQDGEEFLTLVPKAGITTEVHPYPLEKTNEALDDLRNGRFTGAAVVDMSIS